jgi:hypothetical protein
LNKRFGDTEMGELASNVTTVTLRAGSSREEVNLVQEILGIEKTGTFDESTDVAVKIFQKAQSLVADGIVGPKTWAALIQKAVLRKISYLSTASLAPSTLLPATSSLARTWNRYGGLLTVVSRVLGVDVATLLAVLMVESGGNAFGPDGKPLIRFENHIFWRYWGTKNASTFSTHFRYGRDGKTWLGHFFRKSASDPWTEMHVGTLAVSQANEWEAFAVGSSFSSDAAILSTSYGLGQIIGFNAKQAGYSNLQEFASDMVKENLQVIAMLEFMKNGSTMLEAMRQKDFVSFARVYNGPGQPTYYGSLIKKNYDLAKSLGI